MQNVMKLPDVDRYIVRIAGHLEQGRTLRGLGAVRCAWDELKDAYVVTVERKRPKSYASAWEAAWKVFRLCYGTELAVSDERSEVV